MWCVLLASPPAQRGGSVAHVAQRARRARLWGSAVWRGAAGECGSRAVRSGAARRRSTALSQLPAFARPSGAARPNSSRNSGKGTAGELLGRRMRTGPGYWRRAAQFCAPLLLCTREISARRKRSQAALELLPHGCTGVPNRFLDASTVLTACGFDNSTPTFDIPQQAHNCLVAHRTVIKT